jgi:hypothetical protein
VWVCVSNAGLHADQVAVLIFDKLMTRVLRASEGSGVGGVMQ